MNKKENYVLDSMNDEYKAKKNPAKIHKIHLIIWTFVLCVVVPYTFLWKLYNLT